jgi:hypothetical protein
MRKNNEYMRIYVFRTESRYRIEKLQAVAPSLETVINGRKHTSRCVCSDATIIIAVVRCCRKFIPRCRPLGPKPLS